jgi:succinate-semialdehyde dehydrogenase/glutarate-semialdehyde dehydrogenase
MNRTQIETVNPSTGRPIGSYPAHSPEQAQEILAQLALAQRLWRASDRQERSRLLERVSEILLRDQEALALRMAEEMGKSKEEGRAEVAKCAACARYYVEHGPAFLEPIPVQTEAERSLVAFRPLGVVLAIMPWNFPLWQVFRCALPAIMAGNAVALKHASNVTGCALQIEKIWREAAGEDLRLFRTLVLPGERSLALIADPKIAAVSFTGSTSVGKKIAQAAGLHLKKCVLELGGSDPYVVLKDADLPHAARMCAQSRLINGGQSCIAAKRFIVEAPVRARFEELLREEMLKIPVPPLAREDLRSDLHAQVEKSVQMGAKLALGGALPAGHGWFYPATILSGVKPGMPAFDEELFGPVAAVIEAKDEDHALSLANQTEFGLGAAVFTANRGNGELIATEKLEAGSCFVNDFVRSDPRLPFGGVKNSGFGRELSEFGIREFVNIKTIYVGKA